MKGTQRDVRKEKNKQPVFPPLHPLTVQLSKVQIPSRTCDLFTQLKDNGHSFAPTGELSLTSDFGGVLK